MLHEGYVGVRFVGQSRDGGADIIGHRNSKRWLFQVKRWGVKVGASVVDRTLEALRTYRADIPVIVSLNGFASDVRDYQQLLLSRNIPLQLWDRVTLVAHARNLTDTLPAPADGQPEFRVRPYQEDAIRSIVRAFDKNESRKALIVMATGLGKTVVAAEALRRINELKNVRFLVVAHTNELVYQLERAFWPFLKASQATCVWNGIEQPQRSQIDSSSAVFACLPTLSSAAQSLTEMKPFDVVLVDECHHVGAEMYENLLSETAAGSSHGPFLLGLTATPWRPDDCDLTEYFGEPLVSLDLVTALNNGFLTNVDYRMFTDNINWEALGKLRGGQFTPRAINRTLFINEWDDGVVTAFRNAWDEQARPRAIVFCGTIDHAIQMRDRINALRFCRAEALFSQSASFRMEPSERNRILCDFHDHVIDVVCAVDIFNEGIDVPDVNIIVFQRVTHSRRIFVQQLGRGLRIAPDKDRVIVLDFVSDIRRFAAGLELKDRVSHAKRGDAVRVRLPNKVEFRRLGGEDIEGESFLRAWLQDAATIERAGEDASVLKYPPPLAGARK